MWMTSSMALGTKRTWNLRDRTTTEVGMAMAVRTEETHGTMACEVGMAATSDLAMDAGTSEMGMAMAVCAEETHGSMA